MDAVLAELRGGQVTAYTPADIKRIKALPPAYVKVTLERRPGPTPRTARTTRRSFRIVLEAFGKTEDKARDHRQLAEYALEGAELVINDVRTTPLIFEPGSAIDAAEESGWFTGLSSYYYAH